MYYPEGVRLSKSCLGPKIQKSENLVRSVVECPNSNRLSYGIVPAASSKTPALCRSSAAAPDPKRVHVSSRS